jgi:uncharacterized membrane protein (DUF485 family)
MRTLRLTAAMAAGPHPRATERDTQLRALARARIRIAFALTLAVVVLYFGFIGAVAFARPWLGRLVVPGLSLGILLGALVIVAAWLLTLVYVRWTNTHYDPALRALRD